MLDPGQVERIVKKAGKDEIEAIEVFEMESEIRDMVKTGESITVVEKIDRDHGIGIKVIGKEGYSYAHTNRISRKDIEEVFDRASIAARKIKNFRLPLAPPAENQKRSIQERTASTGNSSNRKELIAEIEDFMRESLRGKKVQTAVAIVEGNETIRIFNSRDLRVEFKTCAASIVIRVTGQSRKKYFLFEETCSGCELKKLGWKKIAEKLSMLVNGLRDEEIKERKTDIELAPGVFAGILSRIHHIFNGVFEEKTREEFNLRTGEKIGSEVLNITDDATLDGLPGSVPYDGDGLKTKRVEIVKNGVLVGLLENLLTSVMKKKAIQSNGRRTGYRSLSVPGPSNFFIEPVKESLETVSPVKLFKLLEVDFNEETGNIGIHGLAGENIESIHNCFFEISVKELFTGIKETAGEIEFVPYDGITGIFGSPYVVLENVRLGPDGRNV